MTGHILLLAAVLAAVAAGQPATASPDSVPKAAAQPDSTGRAKPDSMSGRYVQARSPAKAVLLSFLLPGGGQVYTGNYLKAALIAPAELTLGYLSYRAHRQATDAQSANDPALYLRYRDERTKYLWWTGAVIVFSMADAYVSAQMFGFDREMRLAFGPVRAGLAMGI